MKSELEDFDGDTDADLAAYVQVYRTGIADMTDEIDAKEREKSMRPCVMAASTPVAPGTNHGSLPILDPTATGSSTTSS